MKTTRRKFLQTSTFASLVSVRPAMAVEDVPSGKILPENEALDAFAIASQHVMTRENCRTDVLRRNVAWER